jgi:hypothetical protein
MTDGRSALKAISAALLASVFAVSLSSSTHVEPEVVAGPTADASTPLIAPVPRDVEP